MWETAESQLRAILKEMNIKIKEKIMKKKIDQI